MDSGVRRFRLRAGLTQELGRYGDADAHCRAALALYREHRDLLGEAAALTSLGDVAQRTGQDAQAIEHYRQALDRYRELGHSYFSADTFDRLGQLYAARGDAEQARTAWQEALERYSAQGREEEADRVQRQLGSNG